MDGGRAADDADGGEFGDFVRAAVDVENVKLLEITAVNLCPRLLEDAELRQIIESQRPGAAIEIESGYFWKRSTYLRSRLAVARRATVNGQPIYVLPDGQLVDDLANPTKGGG